MISIQNFSYFSLSALIPYQRKNYTVIILHGKVECELHRGKNCIADSTWSAVQFEFDCFLAFFCPGFFLSTTLASLVNNPSDFKADLFSMSNSHSALEIANRMASA